MREDYKSGFVAIIGRPNVGKSTLMNHLIGQKIAITSRKAQTTRNKIQTVYTCECGQIVFLDTPGIHKAKNKLGEYMVNIAERSLNEVDVVLWLVEPSTFIGAGEKHIIEQLKKVKMAKDASFEERFLVTGLLLDGLNGSFLTYEKMDGETGAVYQELLHLKAFLQDKKDMTALDEFTDMKKKSLAVRLEAELLTADQQTTEELVIRTLEEFSLTIRKEHITETEAGFERIRQLFTEMAEKRKACAKKITGELEQAFAFMKECFGDGQETVLFVTGLTRNTHAAAFIREYGCDPYFACSEKLLYRKQERKLQEECASLLEI